MRDMKCRAYYKPLKRMLAPDQIESINFETKVFGVYIEMDGKGYHKLRMSDFEIMWYTGLQDRNEKDIYEGDIVEAWSCGHKHTGQIEWRQEGNPCYIIYPAWRDGKFWHIHGNHEGVDKSLVVIGNIYDTPELLGEGIKR